MFRKQTHIDVKKSTAKIQDAKKDLATRLKHLKIILDNVDIAESKGLFETNFSHVYNILYDSFVQAETNLRQRVHKAHKEELETALWVLENILALLPELLHKRWQIHSLRRILSKLLHPGNCIRVRRQAIKYFLMWYQALEENAPNYVHQMFAALVPGFSNMDFVAKEISTSVFHDTNMQHPVSSSELVAVLPPPAGERNANEIHNTQLFLETLMQHMITTVVRLEWHDKAAKQHKCFQFLLQQFKVYYLPKICPDFSHETSLYKPILDIPGLRKSEPDSEFMACRVILIKWIVQYMYKGDTTATKKPQIFTEPSRNLPSTQDDENQHHDNNSHNSLDSTASQKPALIDTELPQQIIQDILMSTRDNINFQHELFRQAFLLNFNYSSVIHRVIAYYKDLIQMVEFPHYLLEPPEGGGNMSGVDDSVNRSMRIRNDSYIGAVHKENVFVRAGFQSLLRIFVTHASAVFLQQLPTEGGIPSCSLLEEQTDSCKRVLNIYRFMVMHTRMDSNTWEQLLLVLLQITSLVLPVIPPKKKQQTLGGKLAPAIFQTLIVTWIKANLNVPVSRHLWDKFLQVLTDLTKWQELITEWAKTMETLTRVLARYVYNLDLTDLPLDRLMENKSRRTRRGPSKTENSSSLGQSQSLPGDSITRRIVKRGEHADDDDDDDEDDTVDGRRRKQRNIDVNIKRRTRNDLLTLVRSFSETSLANSRNFPSLITNVDLNNSRSAHRHRMLRLRRAHSLGTIPPRDSDSTDRTRSPSPAPSSGLESTSIKDSPIQLDVLTDSHNIPSTVASTTATLNQQQQYQSSHLGIVCGGNVKGWLPDVAVILWRRMLGALGDINRISEPDLHARVFDYLVNLSSTLIKIKQNQGISGDNQSTPEPPELIPPLTLIVPWCFEALNTLPDDFQAGKLSAIRLLCSITLECELQYQRNYLPHFYRIVHLGLCNNNQAVVNTIIKNLGPRFLSLQLPGYSLLLLDLVHACHSILSGPDVTSSAPRTNAVSILANLFCIAAATDDNLSTISVLQPDPECFNVMCCPDIKEHVIGILLQAGRYEPTGIARCIALSSLGIFIYRELSNKIFHPRIPDAINILLLALTFNHKIVAHVATDALLLLCEHAALIHSNYPRLVARIIHALGNTLQRITPLPSLRRSAASERDHALVTALLICLSEWCMKLGPNRLIHLESGDVDGGCLLLTVFKTLTNLSREEPINEIQHQTGLTDVKPHVDFDPILTVDNLESSDVTSTNGKHSQSHSSSVQPKQSTSAAITLCANTMLSHLVTQLGHFPMAIGASRLSSLVVEHDDVPNLRQDELSSCVFGANNIQLLMLTSSVITSLIELPTLDLPGGGVTAGLKTADRQVRVLLRDQNGKSCWDASILYRPPTRNNMYVYTDNNNESILNMTNQLVQPESLMILSSAQPHMPQYAIRHRPPNQLPDITNAAPDLDQLDDLLQFLGYTSPECLETFDSHLNEPATSAYDDIEHEAIATVLSQRTSEREYLLRMLNVNINSANKIFEKPPSSKRTHSTFQYCRLLFSQLGLSGWDHRKQLYLLEKNEKLLRELRNLDSQRCRETHKVAIIYIAPGQEDKTSILSNASGSPAYEQFLAGLAWEIELESHTGFMGGLQRQGSTGETAPYFATSFMEVIFHVATRMNNTFHLTTASASTSATSTTTTTNTTTSTTVTTITDEVVLNKIRHLGNDEVHVVWSEHNRDYRRDIIPTEFCDILIVIYPLENKNSANNCIGLYGLYRVTVSCKPGVPYFGPLFDEAVIEGNVLPGLIRATVIAASRAKRTTLPYYQQYYEERQRSLSTVVQKYVDRTTYEEFIAQVFSPSLGTTGTTGGTTQYRGNAASGIGGPSARSIDGNGRGRDNRDNSIGPSPSLTAALFLESSTTTTTTTTTTSISTTSVSSNIITNHNVITSHNQFNRGQLHTDTDIYL